MDNNMNNINIEFIRAELMKTTKLQPDEIKIVLLTETKGIRIFLTKSFEDYDTLSDELLDYVREFGYRASNVDYYTIPEWEVIASG